MVVWSMMLNHVTRHPSSVAAVAAAAEAVSAYTHTPTYVAAYFMLSFKVMCLIDTHRSPINNFNDVYFRVTVHMIGLTGQMTCTVLF